MSSLPCRTSLVSASVTLLLWPQKGMCQEKLRGEWVCCFGQSGFVLDLLPWRPKGSRVRLDQGTDDTECPLLRSGLCSHTCARAQRNRLGNGRG